MEWYTSSSSLPHDVDVIPRVCSVEPMGAVRFEVARQTRVEIRNPAGGRVADCQHRL